MLGVSHNIMGGIRCVCSRFWNDNLFSVLEMWKGKEFHVLSHLCSSAPAAHRGHGARGDTAPQGLVRARHEEQRPRPEHRRRQRHPRARAVLQGESVCLRWAIKPGEELRLMPAVSVPPPRRASWPWTRRTRALWTGGWSLSGTAKTSRRPAAPWSPSPKSTTSQWRRRAKRGALRVGCHSKRNIRRALQERDNIACAQQEWKYYNRWVEK